MRAVRFDRYGGIDVLDVREVDDPEAAPGRVVVELKAAGVNPGEMAIREGFLHERWPATFPSGQGSDLAGVVVGVGPDVTAWRVGDEVLGFSHERSSHAELIAVPADQLVAKPAAVPWEVAGALYVVGVAQDTPVFRIFLDLLGLVGGGLAAIFALGAFTKTANAPGALTGGLVSAALMYYVRESVAVNTLFYGFISFVSAFVVGYAVSLATRKTSQAG